VSKEEEVSIKIIERKTPQLQIARTVEVAMLAGVETESTRRPTRAEMQEQKDKARAWALDKKEKIKERNHECTHQREQ
jgi:hypothetical protein